MKKLSIVSMIGAAALSALALTGCPTANPDAEYLNSATAIFACGNSEEFGAWDPAKGPEFKNEGNNIFTYEFEATTTEEQFKILVDNRRWDGQAHNGPAPITLGAEETWEVSDGGMANPSLATSIGSTYKITVDGSSNSSLKVKVEQTSASLTPTLQMFFDAVPYDLSFDGEVYTTTATAASDGAVNFLFKDSNGNYWSKKEAVSLGTEVTLSSSAAAPAVTSIASAKKGYVYQFTAKPTFNGDGDEISSMTLKVEELAPIQYPCFNSNIGNKTLTYTVNGTEATAALTFTYNKSDDGWSSGDGVVEFGICDDTSWTHKYVGATLTVGGDFVECTSDGSNNKVTGLKEGTSYKVTVKTTVTKVSVKIEEVSE